jgi:hypothetical protein
VTTPEDVARWLLSQLREQQTLYQNVAVYGIIEQFGEDFAYHNDTGNPAIARNILAAFRRLTGDTVVWDRSERCWRFREGYDEPGRRQ